ncbi:MAG: phage tail sheath family protein [Symploca sp. SIO1B1]|nr:phage tail sheath family protein [Symploca sp. SIO1B1]
MLKYSTNKRHVPGVYTQIIPPPVKPKLLTGIPVFLGVAKSKGERRGDAETRGRGGENESATNDSNKVEDPKRLRLWMEFEEEFKDYDVSEYLSHAVRGFFQNGGSLCYVAPMSEVTLEALTKSLESIETLDIDLVCAPDIVSQDTNIQELLKAVLEHCDRMGDRFAILDAPQDGNQDYYQGLQGNNGAMYAPWLDVKEDIVPPCGHIAGIYARCDREYGVHRAPANFILEGVYDLQQNLNQPNQSAGERVNYIRSFRGRGIRVWGARTVSLEPEWQFVNVRRLFLTFRRWVEQNLADVVFEPNTFELWVRLERELSVYCQSLWQQGALQGDTPQEAFYVKCDEETNPPEVRDQGQVITEIGLAPVQPCEFIVVSLIQNDSGVTLN